METIQSRPKVPNETDYRAVYEPDWGRVVVVENGGGARIQETSVTPLSNLRDVEYALRGLGWQPTDSGWWRASYAPGLPYEYDCYLTRI